MRERRSRTPRIGNRPGAQAARVSTTRSWPSTRRARSMRAMAVRWRGSSIRRTAFSSTRSRWARATRDRPLSASASASAALAAVIAGTATRCSPERRARLPSSTTIAAGRAGRARRQGVSLMAVALGLVTVVTEPWVPPHSLAQDAPEDGCPRGALRQMMAAGRPQPTIAVGRHLPEFQRPDGSPLGLPAKTRLR